MRQTLALLIAFLLCVSAAVAQVNLIPSGGVGAVTLDNEVTLYNKTLDGHTCVVPGSTTVDFGCATLTFNNASSGTYISVVQTAAASDTPQGNLYPILFDISATGAIDAASELSNASGHTVYTAKSSSVLLVTFEVVGNDPDNKLWHLFTDVRKNGVSCYRSVFMSLASTPSSTITNNGALLVAVEMGDTIDIGTYGETVDSGNYNIVGGGFLTRLGIIKVR